MRRNIITIDEEKCTGCGLCAKACAEGAIAIIDGKAKLISDTYCDGLGACIGECPEEALTIEEKDADAFDEQAVEEHLNEIKKKEEKPMRGCPGSMAREIRRESTHRVSSEFPIQSELTNWPVQLKLVSPSAPYLRGADLLLVADCVPFALADFHSRFLSGKPVMIGCPKLDNVDYYIDKMTEIINNSNLNSLTVVHMEVPCCSGLTYIAEQALEASGKNVTLQDVTISISGEILETVNA
jgi:Pyruvate/2-oxoacid:ferredoxin oxidoreductase delta subunit